MGSKGRNKKGESRHYNKVKHQLRSSAVSELDFFLVIGAGLAGVILFVCLVRARSRRRVHSRRALKAWRERGDDELAAARESKLEQRIEAMTKQLKWTRQR